MLKGFIISEFLGLPYANKLVRDTDSRNSDRAAGGDGQNLQVIAVERKDDTDTTSKNPQAEMMIFGGHCFNKGDNYYPGP